jgi:hypothetical protein
MTYFDHSTDRGLPLFGALVLCGSRFMPALKQCAPDQPHERHIRGSLFSQVSGVGRRNQMR